MHTRIATGVLTGIAVFAVHAADAPTPAEASATPSRAVMTSDQVVQVLDETVDWYRTLGAQQQASRQPSDLLILYANRQTADQIMKLVFDFARANAELLSSDAGARKAAEEAASEQSLSRLRKRLDDQRTSIQAEIDASLRQAAGSSKDEQAALQSRISVLRGQLDLLNARRNMLSNMAQFASETDATGFGANALTAQTDSSSDASLRGVRDQYDTLAWLFQQTSSIVTPLSKASVLLNQYRRNLANWREATRKQYRDALEVLGLRVALFVGLLAVVFLLAHLWRRAVYRYVLETRRRSRLLLLQKIVLWVLVITIVASTFTTELGSLATFAGLITAGLAVAMQSVLVSIVGYFFLIGKYGIRVGDRVQIGP